MTVQTIPPYQIPGELTRGESLSIEESIATLGTYWTTTKCLKN